MSSREEAVTVTLTRGEHRLLVQSARDSAFALTALGDNHGALVIGYIATKVVEQIDPEWSEAQPIPPDIRADAEEALAHDPRLHD